MKKRDIAVGASNAAWLEHELTDCQFHDERLNRRFHLLLTKLWGGIGQSIPLACQDWANTKAAYRFFSNAHVNEEAILAGHFQSTRERFIATQGPVLVLQDTTVFSFQRDNHDAIGITNKAYGGKDECGNHKPRTVCGMLMHASLAVTPEGLPLGLAAIKFWSRHEFKGCTALKRKINPTRVPIEQKESMRWLDNLRLSTVLFGEPQRCVHVGDRESDIYELYCAAQSLHTHFLVRTCVDRLAGDGSHTIADEMDDVCVKGLHRIEVRDRRGNISTAVVELKYRRVHVLPPIGKQASYPDLMLTVLHAHERGIPAGRDPIDWKLITDLPVKSRNEAIEKLQWYSKRWQIETFHKIIKSGCKVELSKLRTAERLVNLLAVCCILSWRIFWMTMIQRKTAKAKPQLVFTATEIKLLDNLVKDHGKQIQAASSLSQYLIKLACLGGYLARSRDPPPGNAVMWKGLIRLTDIEIGYMTALKDMGK